METNFCNFNTFAIMKLLYRQDYRTKIHESTVRALTIYYQLTAVQFYKARSRVPVDGRDGTLRC